MGVVYVNYYGKRVSRRWNRVLREADRQGVRFHLNSGHRTMREQWALYNQLGQYHPVTNPHGAAFPSPKAPHIRPWTAAHALDIDSNDGGETRFERWVERHGVNWMNTVRGESWHGELSTGDLRKLDRKLNRRN